MLRRFLLPLLPLLPALPVLAPAAHAAQLSACAAGSTTCSNDTANAGAIVAAINDQNFQARVWWLWLQQCNNIFSEGAATAGHAQRVAFCQAIAADGGPAQGAANRVPMTMLAAMVMNPTVTGEVLAGTPPAGNAVDADINTAIDAALTVSGSPVTTTGTGAAGAFSFTVASAGGISAGMSAAGPGIPAGAAVTLVSGTTVVISAALAAALSASPVSFAAPAGLATRSW